MTSLELFAMQAEDAGYQLGKCLEGMSETQLDARLAEGLMTPREMVAHLAECYHAVTVEAGGAKYQWGTYSVPSLQTTDLLGTFRSLRSAALQALAEKGEDGLKQGCAFIVGHDYYHVGQLVANRIAADPSWDSYSIYRF
jgi:uncharacterized damage-inducible protein DinB